MDFGSGAFFYIRAKSLHAMHTQKEYITIRNASKLTGKHVSTLSRIAKKVSKDGLSYKDQNGQWMIERSYIVKRYSLHAMHTRNADNTNANTRKADDQNAKFISIIENFQIQIERLNGTIERLTNENRALQNKLLGQGKKDDNNTRFILVAVLIVVASALVVVLLLGL